MTARRERCRTRANWLAGAVLLIGLIGLRGGWAAEPAEAAPTAEQVEFFEKHIRPVLVERCYACHAAGAVTVQGGLRLDTAEATRRGGDSGPAVVPGKPSESLLLEALRYESYEMPPDGKLPEAVVEQFARWIEMGAPDPRRESAAPAEAPADAAAGHWAFQPPVVPELPEVQDEAWPINEIDRFVLARLEHAGLSPSPPAEAPTLLRRLAYDLTGLPPSADERAEFDSAAADQAAYAAAVDRYLDSPRFGERWARHWLDVARYADTKGYVFQEDRNYPQAYTYRDWVIQAFNRDLAYDRFLLAQLAADQSEDPADRPAAGFLTLGRRFINNRHDIIDDRIDVTTRGLMGLTVSCARCHDHKYDPVTIADYYALYGVFASSEEPKQESAPLLLVDRPQLYDPVVFIRGNPANRGQPVPRRFLSCLSPGEEPFQNGSGRLELAQAIASPENPLTARVWVNRVWLQLFGEGLVTTPSDFGTRSDPPSHPELLDWLACRFMQEGWSTKWLIRQIVSSQVYRQASHDRAECRQVDPENRLLWRANRRRLDLEALRDSLLMAAGRLELAMGGPSVELTSAPFPTRRTVYGFIERQNLPGMFRTFDFAGPDTHSPKRPYTTVPQQALFLLNSPFALEQAAHLAQRPEVQAAADDQQRIAALFRCALGRDPEDAELAAAAAFLEQGQADAGEAAVVQPWQYGWGRYDAEAERVHFQPLPHFTGQAWQGGPQLPDPVLGWTMLNASGGHPGDDQEHAAIRRWTAAGPATLRLEGTLQHSSEQGDGVRGRVVSDRQGLVGEWEVHNGRARTVVEDLKVEAGETLDLVADCRSGPAFDGFRWTVRIRGQSPAGAEAGSWSSAEQFRGPQPPGLDRWQQLAHVLLLTNEFAFTD